MNLQRYNGLTTPVFLHSLSFADGDVQTLTRCSGVCKNWNETLNSDRAYGIFLLAIRNNPNQQEFLESRLVSLRKVGEEVPKTVKELKSLMELYQNIAHLRMNLVKTITIDYPTERTIATWNTTKDYLLVGDSVGEITAISRKTGVQTTLSACLEIAPIYAIVTDPTQNFFVSCHKKKDYNPGKIVVWSLKDLTVKFETTDQDISYNVVIYKQYLFYTHRTHGFSCVDFTTGKQKHLLEGSGLIFLKGTDLCLVSAKNLTKLNIDQLIEFFNSSSSGYPPFSNHNVSLNIPISISDIGPLGIRTLEHSIYSSTLITSVMNDTGETLITDSLSCHNMEQPTLAPPFNLSVKRKNRDLFLVSELPGLPPSVRELEFNTKKSWEPGTNFERFHYDDDGNVFISAKFRTIDKRFTIYHYQFGATQPKKAVPQPTDKGDAKEQPKPIVAPPKVGVVMKVYNYVRSFF